MSRETCCALHNRLIDRKTHRRHSARRENPQELAESIRYCTVPMWLGNHLPLVGLNSLQFVWRPLSSPWTNEQAFYWNLKRLGISKAALEGSDGEKMRDPLSRSANFFWRHRTWPDRFQDISINTCWCLVGYWRVLLLWQISSTSIIKTFFFSLFFGEMGLFLLKAPSASYTRVNMLRCPELELSYSCTHTGHLCSKKLLTASSRHHYDDDILFRKIKEV